MDKKEKFDIIEQDLRESSNIKLKILEECKKDMQLASEMMVSTLESGGRLLFCGNGGSAADSQHIASEFVVKLNFDRDSLPAISFTTNTSVLTAASNDYGYKEVFARQVKGLANKEDLLVGISTSGNSENVLEAIKAANELGLETIGLTGMNGGKLKDMVSLPIIVPSNDVKRIQEGHIAIGHILCEVLERDLFN